MFYENLIRICAENSVKPTNVVEELGFSSGNLSRWKNGIIPGGKTLKKFSDYFNVPIDYFLDQVKRTPDNAVKVMDKIVSKSPSFSDEENEILKIFQALNKEGQEIILNTARGLEASGRYKKLDSSENKITS